MPSARPPCLPRLEQVHLGTRMNPRSRAITPVFQSSPGSFPRTKEGRAISLPGKELDNTHLSSFHMVLFLTV